MEVRMLIEELLDFPMDSEVSIRLLTQDDENHFNFEIESNSFFGKSADEAYFTVNLSNKKLTEGD